MHRVWEVETTMKALYRTRSSHHRGDTWQRTVQALRGARHTCMLPMLAAPSAQHQQHTQREERRQGNAAGCHDCRNLPRAQLPCFADTAPALSATAALTVGGTCGSCAHLFSAACHFLLC